VGPCENVVGDYEAFSILIKSVGPAETADKTMADLRKMKIAVSHTLGIGDRSFFSSPGYRMIQLNTFKGSHYLIITMMLPGVAEEAEDSRGEVDAYCFKESMNSWADAHVCSGWELLTGKLLLGRAEGRLTIA
jgi:hypothetical protein